MKHPPVAAVNSPIPKLLAADRRWRSGSAPRRSGPALAAPAAGSTLRAGLTLRDQVETWVNEGGAGDDVKQ